MEAEAKPLVTLDQALYGYDDGHRMIASSRPFPEEAAARLLLHSDLAPGLTSIGAEGYWTGIPLRNLRSYALMRTWPAYELPRPGCVWTHVLLIAFADIARFPDLGVLAECFVRPNAPQSVTAYSRQVAINPTGGDGAGSKAFTREEGLRVLRAAYMSPATGTVPATDGPLVPELFALWSQQWPRLRRSFSFQTAGTLSHPSASDSPFSLRFVSDMRTSEAPEVPTDWETAAIDDLMAPRHDTFRRFLWRYGSDIRRGQQRFRFLAQLFTMTNGRGPAAGWLDATLGAIARELPDLTEGKLLKEDLISCGMSVYSLLPASDPVEIISFFVRDPGSTVLPIPPDFVFESAAKSVSARPDAVLAVAQQAADQVTVVANELFRWIAAVAEPSAVLGMIMKHTEAIRRIVGLNPSLLDSPQLVSVPLAERTGLLELLPDNESLVRSVLHQLLPLDEPTTANLLAPRFPQLTTDSVVAAISANIAGDAPPVPKSWIEGVRSLEAINDCISSALPQAYSLSKLAACAYLINYSVRSGIELSPEVWKEAVSRSRDDLHGDARLRLLAFLLTMFLARPTQGLEPMAELAFQPVYSRLEASSMPQDLLSELLPRLPYRHWWQEWDYCKRLCNRVAQIYVSEHLSYFSFYKLISANYSVGNQLLFGAMSAKGGKQYVERMAQTVAMESAQTERISRFIRLHK